MRRIAPALLVLSILLSGCTLPGFGGPSESGAGVDDDPNAGFDGPGVQLVGKNEGAYPVTATWTLIDEHGTNRGTASVVVPPGAQAERKLPFPGLGAYTVRLQYNWTGDGRASSGLDTQSVHTSECPKLHRLAWSMSAGAQGPSGVGFMNRACA